MLQHFGEGPAARRLRHVPLGHGDTQRRAQVGRTAADATKGTEEDGARPQRGRKLRPEAVKQSLLAGVF